MRSLLALMVMMLGGVALAQWEVTAPIGRGPTPVMISLFDPVQLPSSNFDVRGVRLDLLYGDCANLQGLDIGVVNQVSGQMTGIELGALNITTMARGVQLAIINSTETLKGLQIGLINYSEAALGVQIGLVNIIADKDWAFLPILNMSF